jgi:hypothetical protein
MTTRSTSSAFEYLGIPGGMDKVRSEIVEIVADTYIEALKEATKVAQTLEALPEESDVSFLGMTYILVNGSHVIDIYYTRPILDEEETESLNTVLIRKLMAEVGSLRDMVKSTRGKPAVMPDYNKNRYTDIKGTSTHPYTIRLYGSK